MKSIDRVYVSAFVASHHAGGFVANWGVTISGLVVLGTLACQTQKKFVPAIVVETHDTDGSAAPVTLSLA